MIIKTNRLVLRDWVKEDLEAFAQMNADPRVREYFPSILTKQVSDSHVKIMSDHIQKYGWGFLSSFTYRNK